MTVFTDNGHSALQRVGATAEQSSQLYIPAVLITHRAGDALQAAAENRSGSQSVSRSAVSGSDALRLLKHMNAQLCFCHACMTAVCADSPAECTSRQVHASLQSESDSHAETEHALQRCTLSPLIHSHLSHTPTSHAEMYWWSSFRTTRSQSHGWI